MSNEYMADYIARAKIVRSFAASIAEHLEHWEVTERGDRTEYDSRFYLTNASTGARVLFEEHNHSAKRICVTPLSYQANDHRLDIHDHEFWIYNYLKSLGACALREDCERAYSWPKEATFAATRKPEQVAKLLQARMLSPISDVYRKCAIGERAYLESIDAHNRLVRHAAETLEHGQTKEHVDREGELQGFEWKPDQRLIDDDATGSPELECKIYETTASLSIDCRHDLMYHLLRQIDMWTRDEQKEAA